MKVNWVEMSVGTRSEPDEDMVAAMPFFKFGVVGRKMKVTCRAQDANSFLSLLLEKMMGFLDYAQKPPSGVVLLSHDTHKYCLHFARPRSNVEAFLLGTMKLTGNKRAYLKLRHGEK